MMIYNVAPIYLASTNGRTVEELVGFDLIPWGKKAKKANVSLIRIY